MLKAVIVDDDVSTLNGLKKAVNWDRLNIQVVGTAKNGQEGLDLIEASRPDLVLTDIYMPGIDGIEMLKILRSRKHPAEVVILSGYEDFKYAKSALKLNVHDYISKPATIDEIETVLQSAAAKIRSQSLALKEDKELRELLEYNRPWARRQLVKALLEESSHVKSAHFDKAAAYVKVELTRRHFSVVLIEFPKDEASLHGKPGEWPLFSHALNNVIEETVGTKTGIYVADVQQQMVTILVSASAASRKEALTGLAKQLAQRIVETIRQSLKLNSWAAIGSVVDSAGDIHLSYKEAMNLMEKRHYLLDSRIITKNDLHVKPREQPLRPIESYHAMAEAAIQGHSELAGAKIGEFLTYLRSRSDLSIGILREFAVDFSGVLVAALYDHGLRIEDADTNCYSYKEMERICSQEDLASWMNEMLQSVCRLMEKRVSTKHKKTVDFMVRFVHANYGEDISLDMIADKVFLTRNYLSQIFKQATGENYNAYLTKVRMEKAKELMMTGNYKLYEISQMVGYKNNAYFSQLFKKYSGYNPSEFNQ